MTDIQINDKTDRDLLVLAVHSINELKENLASFARESREDGFPRCVLRGEKIENMEKSIKWAKRTAVGAFIGLLAGLIQGWFARG